MHNPICPWATQRILYPEVNERPVLYPVASCAHTAVTSMHGGGLGVYFDLEEIDVESHFYIDQNGELWQFMPVNRQAYAQFAGNRYCVSYETWDNGDPEETPWNTAQLETIHNLLVWLRLEWDIPTTLCASPKGPGAGYHAMFEAWNKEGHSCPGYIRISQFLNYIIPTLNAVIPGGDLVLDAATVAQLNEILNSHLGGAIPPLPYQEGSIQHITRSRNHMEIQEDKLLSSMNETIIQLTRMVSELTTRLVSLEAKVSPHG